MVFFWYGYVGFGFLGLVLFISLIYLVVYCVVGSVVCCCIDKEERTRRGRRSGRVVPGIITVTNGQVSQSQTVSYPYPRAPMPPDYKDLHELPPDYTSVLRSEPPPDFHSHPDPAYPPHVPEVSYPPQTAQASYPLLHID